MKRIRLLAVPGMLLVAAATLAAARPAAPAVHPAAAPHMALNCRLSSLCAEVANPREVFGTSYVGHDEPSTIFYSNARGAGNRMQYSIRLPRDPSPANPNAPGKSYQFELNGTFWLGMALCDTQSYPEQTRTCTPDSDANIVDPAKSPAHAGTAFLELQFYPPGWIPWPTWQQAVGASGCDPTRWCAAMTIDSLSQDPVAGTTQNATCAAKTGLEYVNFAFVSKDGRTEAPANPVQSTTATFTPDRAKDLLMNAGDQLAVSLSDTPHGIQAVIHDRSSGATGSMTASAANGFGQVKYDPAGTSCVSIPYDFHPMYATSSEQTRVIWAAHTYNIAFSEEIGHFQTCTGPVPVPATKFGLDASGNPVTCPAGDTANAGFPSASPPDGDDDFCFPGSEAQVFHVSGCTDSNTAFDGLDYQPVWPDGNRALHPEPVLFSSPRTGRFFTTGYSRMAFEADLPRIETDTCDRSTGQGCTLIPLTERGTPAAFYPFYSAFSHGGHGHALRHWGGHGCLWAFGNDLPGATTDFGRNAQYGSLLSTTYLTTGGGTVQRINNFRQVMNTNPCPAGRF
jgi:hypothetical protein